MMMVPLVLSMRPLIRCVCDSEMMREREADSLGPSG